MPTNAWRSTRKQTTSPIACLNPRIALLLRVVRFRIEKPAHLRLIKVPVLCCLLQSNPLFLLQRFGSECVRAGINPLEIIRVNIADGTRDKGSVIYFLIFKDKFPFFDSFVTVAGWVILERKFSVPIIGYPLVVPINGTNNGTIGREIEGLVRFNIGRSQESIMWNRFNPGNIRFY